MARPHPIDTVILALLMVGMLVILRVFFTEPYVIPTGSMAPTLLGAHRHVQCPECGGDFDIDAQEVTPTLHCPTCRAAFPTPQSEAEGDRVLVDKTVSHPRRFDVMVFLNPQDQGPSENNATKIRVDGPRTTFVKRVIGLPGEDLYLLDGNVYMRPDRGGDFHVLRKTDPSTRKDWQSLQESLFRPIYRQQADNPFPWQTQGDWQIEGHRWFANHGTLTFDFGSSREQDGVYGTRPAYDAATLMPYDQCRLSGAHVPFEPIEEIALSCTVSPTGPRSQVTLATQARLDGPEAERLSVVWADGQLCLRAGERLLGQTAVSLDHPATLTLWFIDGEALAFVDEHCLLRRAFDPPWDGDPASILKRTAPRRFPAPEITVSGGVALSDIRLDADLNWLARTGQGPARGGLMRRDDGEIIPVQPVLIPSGNTGIEPCYWMLGDNSAFSTDSRYWTTIHPWVKAQSMGGYALPGLVPERLFCGRVIAVPYPGGGRLREVRRIR